MPFTATPELAAFAAFEPRLARIASNSGCFALYTWFGSPLTLSALARLLAVVLRRTDCALMPLPAMSKMLKEDMWRYLYWPVMAVIRPRNLLFRNCSVA